MKYRSIVVGLVALAQGWTAPAGAADFQQDILPLLADRCFACHGPDAAQRKAGLRLDLEDGAIKEVVVAGDPDASALLHRITTDDPDDRMPPPESDQKPITPAEAELIRAWIADGAPWAGHWAFTAPRAVELPVVAHENWPRNMIDHFMLARMEGEGLAPAPEADKETLIRRLSFDLTGLPPTLDEIDRFVMDHSPSAYEDLVDRLLASPHYGEHMARAWLDGARYADTNGYQNDFHRVMWPWRDWVIKAFNDNMPYDQFVIEQIAGDLLPKATESQRIATGFNRNNKSVTEGGSIEEEWLVENLVDRVETTSTVFLGLSMGCARCHDHKYDPISQKEFYEFYAFFNSTEDKGFYQETRGNTGPQVMLPSFGQQRELNRLNGTVNLMRQVLDEAKAKAGGDYESWLKALRESAPPPARPAAVLDLPLNGTLPEMAVPARGSETPESPGEAKDETIAWVDGIVGPALALDGTGTSTLQLGDAVTFQHDQPFGVALWVRPDGAGAFFSKMDEANGHRGVDVLVTRGGAIEVHMISTWDANALKIQTDDILKMKAWAHVAITYDGSSSAAGVTIYVNGAEVAAKALKDALSGPIDTTEPLRIGQRTASTYFSGAIAGMQFFDVALAGDAVQPLLEQGLAASLPQTLPAERETLLRGYFDQVLEARVRKEQEAYDMAVNMRNDFEKKIPSVMVMQEREEPRPTYLLKRGAYDAPDTSEVLQPGTPAFLPDMPLTAPRNRLGLAQWLVADTNPLTARVAVNRLWQQVFGRGLVRTAEDFGVQASPPSHPLLLDALAVRFRASGWDVKGLLRDMVTSATYRQSSALNETLLAKDSENRFYARAPRYRFTAEMVRDNALAASGLLSERIGGSPAMPYQPEGLWEELAGGASQGPYVQGEGEDLYRRSLYTHRKRTVPHPTLTTFDAPSFEICLARRGRTNTPLQALALLNDTTYVEAARHLAQRMLTEIEGDAARRLGYGFRLTTGREPTQAELETLAGGLEGYVARYSGDPEAARKLVANGESPAPETLPVEQLAPYMTVAGVLLNLDEAITRE